MSDTRAWQRQQGINIYKLVHLKWNGNLYIVEKPADSCFGDGKTSSTLSCLPASRVLMCTPLRSRCRLRRHQRKSCDYDAVAISLTCVAYLSVGGVDSVGICVFTLHTGWPTPFIYLFVLFCFFSRSSVFIFSFARWVCLLRMCCVNGSSSSSTAHRL